MLYLNKKYASSLLNFTEIEFTYHTIYPFKVYKSVAFTIFIEL